MMRFSRFTFTAATIALLAGCGSAGDDGQTEARVPDLEPVVIEADTPIAEASAAESASPIVRRSEDLPVPIELTGEDWPQYRGLRRDNVSRSVGLRHDWSEAEPRVLWETPVGQGYAAPSVVGGRVYLNDYDESASEWMVRCLVLNTGEELWRYRVKKRIRPNHAITRSAPATDGGFVAAIDPKCELHCLDARDGSLIWRKSLPEAYGGQIPPWYNGQCPLLNGDDVVMATGGRILVTAFDKRTGEPVWETPNDDDWVLSHSSVAPAEIDGVKQYLYTTLNGLIGVDAATGELLWRFPWKFNTAVPTMPLYLGDGKVFLTSGYHAQTVTCQVKHTGNDWVAEELWSLPPPTSGWNSEVQTPIVYHEHIYGVGKKQRGLWTCLDMAGNEVWTSRGEASFGMGGYVLADGMFFVLEGKTGVLRVLDANADHYQELANVQLLAGPDVWAPPVISQGKLLIRDLQTLICLDIAEPSEQTRSRTAAAGSVRH